MPSHTQTDSGKPGDSSRTQCFHPILHNIHKMVMRKKSCSRKQTVLIFLTDAQRKRQVKKGRSDFFFFSFFYPQQAIYSTNITMFTCTIAKQLSIFKEQVQGPPVAHLEGSKGLQKNRWQNVVFLISSMSHKNDKNTYRLQDWETKSNKMGTCGLIGVFLGFTDVKRVWEPLNWLAHHTQQLCAAW